MPLIAHIQSRVGPLLRHRAYLVLALLALGLGTALYTTRLLGVLGFPNALAQNLLLGPLAILTGILAGHIEQVVAGPTQPRWLPLHLLPARRPAQAVAGAVGAALAGSGLLALLGLSLALLGGVILGRCEILRGLAFYPVLLLPSLALGATTGVAITLLARRPWARGLLLVAALALSLGGTLWPILTGPQTFAFNHFLGYLPGPLYDERVRLGLPLLAYRGLTLAWASLVLLTSIGLCDAPRFGLRAWQPRRRLHLGLGAVLAAIAALYAGRHALGFSQSFASVEARLGGRTEVPGIVIHYPAERDARWVVHIREDHAHALEALARWLHIDPETLPPIHAYVFRSAAEKAELTGAGTTSVTKPWLHAIFLVDSGYPHPVVRHELAHALTAAWGTGPLKISGHLLPNAGLVEGVAVAADLRDDPLTLHEWARAMRALGVAPRIRSLFSTYGFLAESPSRAYTLAGSFVRWLADTHGIEAVRRAYHAGTLSVLGDPEALFSAWETFLDALPLSPGAERLARDRFLRPSILRRPCALDVQALREAASAALARRAWEAAERALERCAELEPDDPAHLEALLEVARRAAEAQPGDGRWSARAERLEARLLAHPKLSPAAAARLHAAIGDRAWDAGHPAKAAAQYRAALEQAARAAERRLLSVKLWVLEHPADEALLRPFLQGKVPPDRAMLRLHEALTSTTPESLSPSEARAREALLAYLLGRQLYGRGAYTHALVYLRSAAGALPPIEGLALENLRLIARAESERAFEAPGRVEAAIAAWQAVAQAPDAPAALRELAHDFQDRLRTRHRLGLFLPPSEHEGEDVPSGDGPRPAPASGPGAGAPTPPDAPARPPRPGTSPLPGQPLE